MKRHALGRLLFTIAVLLSIVSLGLFEAEQAAENARTVLQNNLLAQAKAISQAIDPELVKSLSFDANDKSRPAFLRISGQLRAYARITNLRSVYSVAVKGGILRFGPESLDEKDKMASPPGTEYKRPDPSLHSLFQNPKAITIGPYTDEYGSFVSAFVPIIDSLSGNILLVIGADTPLEFWHSDIKNARLSILIFLLPLGAMVIALLVLSYWLHRRHSFRSSKYLRFESTIIVVFIGAVISAFLTHAQYQETQKRIRNNFEQVADTQASDLVERFASLQKSLATLARFIELNNSLSSEAFQRFAAPIVQNSFLQALEWMPIVSAAEAHKEPALFENDGKGGKQPVTGRKFYYPVKYVTPLKGNEAAIGFDVGSETNRMQAISAAQSTGMTSASSPIHLIQDANEQKAIVLFSPVYKSHTAIGFALCIARIQEFAKAIFSTDRINGVTITDITHHKNQQEVVRILKSPDAMKKTYPMFVADRTYAIEVSEQAADNLAAPAREATIFSTKIVP